MKTQNCYKKYNEKIRRKKMDNLTYNAKEVMKMLNCSQATAYRTINEINKRYCKKNKLDEKALVSGKISKKLFHEYYPSN